MGVAWAEKLSPGEWAAHEALAGNAGSCKSRSARVPCKWD